MCAAVEVGSVEVWCSGGGLSGSVVEVGSVDVWCSGSGFSGSVV